MRWSVSIFDSAFVLIWISRFLTLSIEKFDVTEIKGIFREIKATKVTIPKVSNYLCSQKTKTNCGKFTVIIIIRKSSLDETGYDVNNIWRIHDRRDVCNDIYWSNQVRSDLYQKPDTLQSQDHNTLGQIFKT